jgi:hypothetical protein
MLAMVPVKPAVLTSVEVASEMVTSPEMASSATSKMTTFMMVPTVMLRQCRLCREEKSHQNGHGRQMLDHVPLLGPATDQRHP